MESIATGAPFVSMYVIARSQPQVRRVIDAQRCYNGHCIEVVRRRNIRIKDKHHEIMTSFVHREVSQYAFVHVSAACSRGVAWRSYIHLRLPSFRQSKRIAIAWQVALTSTSFVPATKRLDVALFSRLDSCCCKRHQSLGIMSKTVPCSHIFRTPRAAAPVHASYEELLYRTDSLRQHGLFRHHDTSVPERLDSGHWQSRLALVYHAIVVKAMWISRLPEPDAKDAQPKPCHVQERQEQRAQITDKIVGSVNENVESAQDNESPFRGV